MPQEEVKAGQTEVAAPAPADTTLADVKSGKVTMRELSPEKRAPVMDALRKELSEPAADAAPEVKPKDPEPAAKPVEEPVVEKKVEPPLDLEAKKREGKTLADEANRIEQQNKARLARLQKAKEDREAIDKMEVKPPDDAWDKTHQETLHEKVERQGKKIEFLESTLSERDKQDIETLTRETETARDRAIFGTLHTLQDEYPDQLRTSKPFKELNDANAAWVKTMLEKSGVREKMPNASEAEIFAAAAERYQKDPEFQKALPTYPIPEADNEKYKLLVELNAKTMTTGGTVKGHLLEWFDGKGILADVMQKSKAKAAEDAATRTVAAMKKSDDPKPISPSDGSARDGYMEPEMDAKKAGVLQGQIVKKQKAGGNLSPEERLLLPKLNAIIKAAYLAG